MSERVDKARGVELEIPSTVVRGCDECGAGEIYIDRQTLSTITEEAGTVVISTAKSMAAGASIGSYLGIGGVIGGVVGYAEGAKDAYDDLAKTNDAIYSDGTSLNVYKNGGKYEVYCDRHDKD